MLRCSLGVVAHAFATAFHDGSNSLRTSETRTTGECDLTYLHGTHLRLGSNAVSWIEADQFRFDVVKRSYVLLSSLIIPFPAVARSMSCCCADCVEAAKAKGKDKRAKRPDSFMVLKCRRVSKVEATRLCA